MEKGFQELNKNFFKAFDIDQADAVIDMMDDFEKYIHNDLVITKVAIMDCLEEDRSLEEQQVASSCLLGEVLCWSAMVVWKRVFEKAHQMDVHDQIDRIRKSIHRFINAWYKPRTHICISDDPKCEQAITALCNKMIWYLVMDAQRRKGGAQQ